MNKLADLLSKRESLETQLQEPKASPLAAELEALDKQIAQEQEIAREKEIKRLDGEIKALVKDALAAETRLLDQANAFIEEARQLESRYVRLQGEIHPYQEELSLYKATPPVGTIVGMARSLRQFVRGIELRKNLSGK
jgi:predicted  nucleic acid-binding Zn-ribbon protein